MNVLLVHAHPDPESFSAALRDRAVESLRASGHTVEVIDLYADGFAPAMTIEERRAYETSQPICSPQVEAYAAQVRWAQALVFVYPTWWSGLPAILKGWLDRVLVTGVAFDLVDGHVKPRMQHIQVLAGITTHGSGRWEIRLLTDPGRRTIMRTLRLNTGLRTKRIWLDLPNMDRCTLEERLAFLERVGERMSRL